jgi:hypothetical protein
LNPAVLAAGLVVMQVAAGGSATRTMTHSINHYDVDVPDTFTIRDVSPEMADFQFYEVARKNGQGGKLGLYFGNHSGFPKLKWDASPVSSGAGATTRKEFPYSAEKRQMEGLLTFRGLRYMGSSSTPFSLIHYFARDIGEDDAKVFGAIVQSIRVARTELK